MHILMRFIVKKGAVIPREKISQFSNDLRPSALDGGTCLCRNAGVQ